MVMRSRFFSTTDECGGHSTTKEIREAAAFTFMKQNQQDHQDAGENQQD